MEVRRWLNCEGVKMEWRCEDDLWSCEVEMRMALWSCEVGCGVVILHVVNI